MKRKSPFDLKHPFFAPLWRRIATVALCLGWAAFEYSMGAHIWAAAFAAIGLFAAYQFFFTGGGFEPEE